MINNPQEINENNQLIARFMGTGYSATNHLTLYHNNWSWLMSVVDKIESIKFHGCDFYFVEITKLHIIIRGTTQGILRKVEDGEKLTALWLAVVDFIKWYNKKYESKFKDYFADLDKWENSFYCNECGNSEHHNFAYNFTTSNSEVWHCKICKTDTQVSFKPKEDNY